MQIKLTMMPTTKLIVPFDYHYQLQSAIYDKLKQMGVSEFFHDRGYGDKNIYKAFVFGELRGMHRVEDKKLIFLDKIYLEIRSPIFAFTDALQRSFELNREIKIFNQIIEIKKIEVLNEHINKTNAVFQTLSPVEVHETLSDGRTKYFSPDEYEFKLRINDNIARKYEAIYKREPGFFEITPVGNQKKIVTNYKGIWITAYFGKYEISAMPEMMEFIYNTGIGSKNSQGFGMLGM